MKKKSKSVRKIKKVSTQTPEERQRSFMRQTQERLRSAEEKRHKDCLHLAGCSVLSEWHSDLTAIVWHYYNDKVWRGICLVCQRLFVPEDKDYNYWIDKSCFNYASKSHENPSAKGIRLLSSNTLNSREYIVNDPNDWSDEELDQTLKSVQKARAAEKELRRNREDKGPLAW